MLTTYEAGFETIDPFYHRMTAERKGLAATVVLGQPSRVYVQGDYYPLVRFLIEEAIATAAEADMMICEVPVRL